MDKRNLNNIRLMFDSIDEKVLRIECLGYLVKNIAVDGQICDEDLDFGMLTVILNTSIKQVRKKLLKRPRNFRDKAEGLSESFEWPIRQRSRGVDPRERGEQAAKICFFLDRYLMRLETQ